MTERVCLVAYHEIGLKGRNRTTFERRLQDNIGAALVGMHAGPVERAASRLAVPVRDESAVVAVARRVAQVPGVGSVALAHRVSQDPDEIAELALKVYRDAGGGSFRIRTKRSNTDYPERTLELNRRVGDYVRVHGEAKVDLSNPDVTIGITVTKGDVYVFSERVAGVGGLPVGSSGRIVSLLSSGIDSPVATWRMMRRGAVISGVHFSGRPQVNAESEHIVAELGEVLARTGGLGRIYVVPFGDIQKEISLACPPDLRILLYRRLMFRVSERIARIERAKALLTGESLGQVASQTLANIAVVDDASTLPVLRPLIGSDKLEIMAEATRIGTYELSIQHAEDCCSLFMPRNPETQARLVDVLAAWDELPTERMTDDALGALEWIDFRSPHYRPPRQWPTPAGERGWSARRLDTREPSADRQA